MLRTASIGAMLENSYHCDITAAYDHTRALWTIYRKSVFELPRNGEPTIAYNIKKQRCQGIKGTRFAGAHTGHRALLARKV